MRSTLGPLVDRFYFLHQQGTTIAPVIETLRDYAQALTGLGFPSYPLYGLTNILATHAHEGLSVQSSLEAAMALLRSRRLFPQCHQSLSDFFEVLSVYQNCIHSLGASLRLFLTANAPVLKPDDSPEPKIPFPSYNVGLGAVLAKSSCSTVYRAEDSIDGCVRVIKHQNVDTPTSFLLNDIRFQADPVSSHVVRVVDSGLSCLRAPFIVLEDWNGGNLGSHIRSSSAFSFSPQREFSHLRQAVSGLADLHDQGIIHRDFKPENILLDEQKREAKLTDFSIAMRVGEKSPFSGYGTDGYLSPEAQRPPFISSFQQDVYAAGKTLLIAFNHYVLRLPGDRISKIDAIRKGLYNICWTAMDPDLSKRYQDAREMLAALDGILQLLN